MFKFWYYFTSDATFFFCDQSPPPPRHSPPQTAKLKWLQSCVLAIDPTETTIRAHLPVVLHQLKNALTTSTPIISQRGGPDVSVVRLTTHVVNSLASMLPPAGSVGL